MFGFNIYVLGAIALLVLGLTGASYALYERGNAATARAELAETRAAELTQSLQESEADKARVIADGKRLDAALVEKDKRLNVLLAKERNLHAEYNRLKGLLDAKDQECLDRPIPDAIAARLRDTTDSPHQDGKAGGASQPHDALPEIAAP